MGMIIDCDAHVLEPRDLWQNYLEPKYRDQAIRIEPTEDGGEALVIADQIVLPAGLAGLGGANLDRAKIMQGGMRYEDGCPPASYDTAARIQMLDDWGLDGCITLPTIGLLPVPTNDLGLISAYQRAYNSWQMDFAGPAGGRVASIATLNWRDIDAAVEELDRCLAAGFRGAFVPPEPIDGRRPGDPYFDPIWARLAEAGVPGCLHVIVRFSGAAMPFADWTQVEPAMGAVFSFGLGATGQIIPGLTSLIVDGLFDRHPNLNVACVEAGCGWAAYLMDRLDEKFDTVGALTLCPTKRRPSEYIKDNCYFVAEPTERTIGAMLELVGEKNILWGSDFPHIDSDLAAPQQIRASVADLGARQKAAVLGENAARLFKFDL